jgi:hypothetical protein
MRIVTRPDFDGIVCAVLLYQAENIDTDIKWVEPNEIQSGKANILKGDIMANIPYSHNCSLWFDHHISNKPKGDFQGGFDVAPSAARVVYEYYKAKGVLDNEYDELVFNTDIIDAADLTRDQVQRPENYPYILLSMTIKNKDYKDIAYWNRLVDLLKETDIDSILEDPEIKERCEKVIRENGVYEKYLIEHTKIDQKISITDFRNLDIVPDGNRFLTYSLFPECCTSIKIRFQDPKKKQVLLSVGHNIFNQDGHVNIGTLLGKFGGGGHAGAGGCTLNARTADDDINKILDILVQNKKEV